MQVWVSITILLVYVAFTFLLGVAISLMSPRTCVLMQCNARSELMKESVDTDTQPCDNFYQFTCGRIASNRSKNRMTVWDEIERKQLIRLATFLSRENRSDDHEMLIVAKRLYKNCVDPSKRIDPEGLQSFLENVVIIGGFPLLPETYTNGKGSISKTEGSAIMHGLETAHFYEVKIVNIYSSLDPIPRFSTPKALTNKFLPSFEKQVKFVSELYKILSENETITDEVRDVIDKTVRFKEKLWSAADSDRQGLKTYSMVDYAGFVYDLEMRYIHISDPITLLLPGQSLTDILISSGFESYIKKLDELVHSTDYKIIKNYSIIEHVIANILFLPKPLRQIYDKYMRNPDDPSIENSANKQIACANILRRKMATVLSSIYIRHYYSPVATYARLYSMIRNIQKIMKPLINSADWMNTNDKDDANINLYHVSVTNPLPDDVLKYFTNKTEFEIQCATFCFANFTLFDDYLVLNAETDYYNIIHLNTTLPWNIYQEYHDVFSTKIYYDYARKSIIIPSGLLRYPSFHSQWPRYLNFGGFGSLLLLELIRALDFAGVNYGSIDLGESLWSSFAKVNYDRKRRCFLDQYNKHLAPLKGANVTNLNTVNEIIQDNTAIAVAYQAYQEYKKSRFFPEANLKDWHAYTVDQLFFINYATYYCTKFDKTYVKGMTDAEVASPSHEYKVVSSLRNYPKFSEIFNCKIGDGMNPADKCSVF
uniref:Peptidase M13 N-terminal domain-containing protein n=1 Tax=Cuerna arida TaxID=1464854 RepID=A0A1B6G491_9HEMI